MKLNKSLVATALTIATMNTQASSFQLHETSASGLGRAFAGDAVIADDAAVLARNPAAMALFSKQSFSFITTYVDPGVDIKGKAAPDFVNAITGGTFDPSTLDEDGVVPTAFIPAAYYIKPVNDKFAYGVGVNVNFGLASEYDEDYAAGSIGGETDLTTVNMNLSGSYRVNEKLSLGLGANIVYGDAKLVRHAGLIGAALNVPADTEVIKMEGDDFGYGWNIGVVYELDKNNRFGLGYHSEVEIAFEGDYNGLTQPEKIDGTLTIDMPAFTEFSGFHQITSDWAIHYSAMYTEWDSFEKLEAYTDDGLVFAKEENFESTYRIALGATYNYSDKVTVRAGVAKDESAAVEEYRSISIPDSDRLWFTAGVTYQFSDSDSIDFGIGYVDGDKVDVVEEDALLAEIPAQIVGPNKDWAFESEGNALLLSVQYNTSF